jgi:flagellar hook assembly protein FlgD
MFAQAQEGRTSVSWDGKNDNGSAVAPGTYEVRVIAGHYMNSGRIMVE